MNIDNKVVITRRYDVPGYFCSTLMNVRTAALCGDRTLILGSTLELTKVINVLADMGYSVLVAFAEAQYGYDEDMLHEIESDIRNS